MLCNKTIITERQLLLAFSKILFFVHTYHSSIMDHHLISGLSALRKQVGNGTSHAEALFVVTIRRIR